MAKVKPVNKKKMSVASIVALVLCFVILVSFATILMATDGVFLRLQNGASTENFKINGSMMSYYTNSYFQSWYSQYYIYIMYGIYDFDPSLPFDEQIYNKTTGQTYYDFFVEGAKTQVTKILKYCEAAKADPEFDYSALESEAETYAKDTIASLKESAKKSGYTDFRSYLRANFGQYVNENDLKESIVLEYMASEYSQTLYDRIYDSMTDDRKVEFFKENLSSYISAEYLYLTLSQKVSAEKVDASKYELGEDDPKYKEAVKEAQEKAKLQNEMNKIADKELIDRLAKSKDAEEFKRTLLDFKYEEVFNSTYNSVTKGFVDADKPSEEELKEYMASLKQQVIDAVIEGKTDLTTDDEEEEVETADESEDKTEETTETKWEKAKKTFPKTLIANLTTEVKNSTKTVSYTIDTDLGKFLFGGVNSQYGIKDEEGENAALNDYMIDEKEFSETEKEAAEAEGKYTYTVYFVTKPAYRDETILRDVGHILFQVDEKGTTEGAYKTFDEAKAAAEKLLEEIKAEMTDGVISKEKFEEFGAVTNDSNIFYDDVNKGQMVAEFEDWLFAATTVGEVGLVKSEYGYHIMYYGGETVAAWMASAHESATSEDLTEKYESFPYEVTINESIFDSIFK